MNEPFREALRFLWLSSGSRLRKKSILALMGASVTVYSDVVKPVSHSVPLGLLVFALGGAGALSVIAWFAKQHGPLTDASKGVGRRLVPVDLPFKVKLSRDVAELAAVSVALLLMTWGGQRLIAARSSVDRDVPADSVSLFATLIPQLDQLRSDVAGVRSEVVGVRNDVHSVQEALGGVKKEVSDDPRKELANIGVTWSGDTFLEAVRTGDLRVINLFVAGGIPMVSATSQGRPLAVMLALNVTNAGAVLDVLAPGGLDLNHAYEVAGGIGKVNVTLLSRAIEKGNVELVKALLAHHVDVNAAIQTFGVMGAPRSTFPLASAVTWRRMDIVSLLLDNGADPGIGDFAAYREAQSLLQRPQDDESLKALKAVMGRLSPSDAASTRIGDELRLQAVERELNEVALEGLRTMRGTSQKTELDRRYDELQHERTELQQRLGVAGQRRQ